MVVNSLREWKLACPQSELDLVFPTSRGGIIRHENLVRQIFMPVQIAASVTVLNKEGRAAKYSGLHALRHFYASWCINRRTDGGLELPLKIVQHRLGHASIRSRPIPTGICFRAPMMAPSSPPRNGCS